MTPTIFGILEGGSSEALGCLQAVAVGVPIVAGALIGVGLKDDVKGW